MCHHRLSISRMVVGAWLWFLASQPLEGAESSFRPGSNAEQAVRRIEELGGAVRYLNKQRDALEVDFQFAGEKLGNEHLQYLEPLENVVVLRLKRTSITDDGLIHVAGIKTLVRIDLAQTAISDRGLKHLTLLPKLENLNLYGTAVTDDGIWNLRSSFRLENLYVGQTPVTELGVAALLEVAPQIAIVPNVAQDRKDAELFLLAATKLLKDAETQLAQAELEYRDFGSRKDQLKKDEEELRKRVEESKRHAEQLKKQKDKSDKFVADTKRLFDEVSKLAKEQPDYLQFQRAVLEFKKALKESQARTTSNNVAHQQSQKQIEAALAKTNEAKKLFERAKKSVETLESAKKVAAGARLRLNYAERNSRLNE